jgi:hypothetical protein
MARRTTSGALTAEASARLVQLRGGLAAAADPAHAAFHRAYHKSELEFLGVRAPQLRSLWRVVWPPRPPVGRDEALALQEPLWASGCFEEATTAIYVLSRAVKQLGPEDLPLLHALTRRCAGWGHLDFLAEWLWTRRAAILIHCVPARRGRLAVAYAWPSLAARLHEKEFFIRKAIGWTLRECGKHYPQEVLEFVLAHRSGMAGLTFREATRNLPAELRRQAGA